MHYVGTLAANGAKFDSSRDKGRPFQFVIGIGSVIKGWDEGVMKMSLGEKAILRISSDFGYGEHGAGGVIPPNADLIFEVCHLDDSFTAVIYCLVCLHRTVVRGMPHSC